MEIGLFDYTTENLMVKPSDGLADTDALTSVVEVFQENLNELRIGLASQYAAIEQAELSITDLNTQYRLGKDAIDDINFTAEVAALAKSQILQDAANAMLIQANNAQRGLVALVN
jgi:flagellin